ncbi:MAG: sensor domain-containing diguanylate cyclase [Pelomonas sp.]|nr:sensor domain-containing diguanylate cyclase [Roseateles sp.]
MQAAALPTDEPQRLQTLHSLRLLDTVAEERFDRLTRLARRLFDVPIALVSLVDANRQWFKSRAGLEATETPRRVSFCAHAILGDGLFLIPDAQRDPRFADNPLVTGEPFIRFYAGQPLRASNGAKLGTLCLLDQRPRRLGEEDIALLRDLANMAEQELMAFHLATTDELTGVCNRRGFETLARHALGACRRRGQPATLVYFDLNDFKAINDAQGHAAGDAVLRRFATALRDALRESDVVGRLGGDEFVALLIDTPPQGTEAALERLHGLVADVADGAAVRFSVGMVGYDGQGAVDMSELLAEADRAMYAHKRALKLGRGAAPR